MTDQPDVVRPARAHDILGSAKEWFLKAAKENDPKAQSNLGHLLGVDSSANPDRREALKWILIAKEQGEATALKSYKELLHSFPPALLATAQKDANKFLIIQRAKQATDPVTRE